VLLLSLVYRCLHFLCHCYSLWPIWRLWVLCGFLGGVLLFGRVGHSLCLSSHSFPKCLGVWLNHLWCISSQLIFWVVRRGGLHLLQLSLQLALLSGWIGVHLELWLCGSFHRLSCTRYHFCIVHPFFHCWSMLYQCRLLAGGVYPGFLGPVGVLLVCSISWLDQWIFWNILLGLLCLLLLGQRGLHRLFLSLLCFGPFFVLSGIGSHSGILSGLG